jgi:HTH-type transcriptional regulator, sugar sensing transcriptional regulator
MQIKNESLVKSLQKTGLTDKEALVYVSLLELGGAYPSKVAEYCGLKRATTYNVLTILSVRGLVNEIEKRNKIFYQIEKPHKFITYSSQLVEKAKEGLERAEKIMPDLESLFSMLGDKPKVLFFEGPETVSSICKDIISGKGNFEMIGFSNADKFKDVLSAKQLNDFVKAKERLNIKTRGILPDTPANRIYGGNVFKNIKQNVWPEIRYLAADKFCYDAEITIYGHNKIAISKFGSENIIGLIVEDKIIHDMMKMIFELAWNSPEVKE